MLTFGMFQDGAYLIVTQPPSPFPCLIVDVNICPSDLALFLFFFWFCCI